VQQNSQNVDRAVLIVLVEDLLRFDGGVQSYERKTISGARARLWQIRAGLECSSIMFRELFERTGENRDVWIDRNDEVVLSPGLASKAIGGESYARN
jgi:hypothetical protein